MSAVNVRFFVCVESGWRWSVAPETLAQDSSFRYVGGDWALAHAGELLAYYLDRPNLTCCDLAAGFAIQQAGLRRGACSA